MKKYLILYTSLVVLCTFILINDLHSAPKTEEENDDDYEYVDDYEREGPYKGIFFELGSGAAGLSTAVGFRYSFASLALGLSGFANSIPNYSQIPPTGIYFNPNSELPSGYVSEKHTGLIVTGEAGFYLDYFDPITVFGTIGYYSQQDSVLAKQEVTGARYSYKVENTAGITFGLGANYSLSQWVCLGLGFNNKRGVYGQFMYTW